MQINEELAWLYNQKKQKRREDLSRIKKCIELLEIKTNYPIFHIAGTNGKGSTASFIKNILKEANYKVGFFVSPFVISFNERIQINNDYISDEKVIEYISRLKEFSKEYTKEYNDTIPFFELTFLMALLYFQEMNVNVAVIECGLGGRFDATNCLDTDIQIITNIGYDHMQSLGNTLEEIAYHKLGITRENKKCFTCACDELKSYFADYGIKNNVNIVNVDKYVSNIIVNDLTYFKYNNINYHCNLIGEFQAYNAALAIAAINEFDSNIKYDTIIRGLNNVFWPGRMEKISDNPLIIIDGAHNIHGIEALVSSIHKQYQNYYVKTVFTALHDKAYPDMLKKLDEVTDFYYFTSIDDLRATDSKEFISYTSKPYVQSNIEEIFNKAVKELKENELLLVTGSLHFISNARNILLNIIK